MTPSETVQAAATEDAERAAYLERWKDAPHDSNWLAEDEDGECRWYRAKPVLMEGDFKAWNCRRSGDFVSDADYHLLGSVRCEPRPTPEGGQGVEG